jgi:signal peptidase I
MGIISFCTLRLKRQVPMRINKKMQDSIWDWVKAIMLTLLLAVIIRFFIFIPLRVDGSSMSPTLQQNNYIIYEKLTPIRRFDIIIFNNDAGETLIKRVIGLPGDRLEYKDDQLILNGKPVEEPYLKQGNNEQLETFTSDFNLLDLTGMDSVPENSYFVMGDNRNRSNDSRMFGFVSQEDIVGKASMVYYPLDELRFIGE